MKVTALATLALAAAVMAAGCAVFENKAAGPLYPTPAPMVSDVPVPRSFKPVPEKTFYNSTGGTRVGKIVYSGKADVQELLTFYQDNMPISGWNRTKESSDFGSYNLFYEKGRETAQVRITPGQFTSEVAVTINRATAK